MGDGAVRSQSQPVRHYRDTTELQGLPLTCPRSMLKLLGWGRAGAWRREGAGREEANYWRGKSDE